MRRQEAEDIKNQVEQSIRKKFRKTIWSPFTKAVKQYELVKEGDKVAVCISGGKDSMLMAKLFQELKLHNKFPFEVEFLVMDPGYSPDNRHVIEENARKLGIPVHIFESDIFDAVYTIEKSPCYLCARMRRGYLYSYAKELGCNKIALGHHYDDVIETILMGMLYGAQVQTMMPKLHSTNFEGMELIRPLYLVREDDIKAWRDYNHLHFIQCACKFTDSMVAEVIDNTTSRGRTLRFLYDGPHDEFKKALYALGETPLPHSIINRPVEPEDSERFQSIFARNEGAVTAPTASLHFSRELMKRMEIKGIDFAYITLHAGLGNFRDIDVEDLTKHKTDSEQMIVTEEAVKVVNRAKDLNRQVCAVGTTVMRAIESTVSTDGHLKEYEGWTNKFIFPPYDFTVANAMVSNFHMPLSTLLMIVAAFGGYEQVMEAYNVALKEDYRFGTYGDAMLITDR